MLYTSGTTGRPKGVPRSHGADRAGGLPRRPARLPLGDRTLGVMPLYHTMGIHSLVAMHLVGGCFVPLPRWDAGEALRADRGGADHVALPRADALPRSRQHPTARRADLSSVRALGYAGAAMTSARWRCAEVFDPRCSSTTTVDRDLHLLDRP